jgi:MFS superfamily sulfate permease-like transporter
VFLDIAVGPASPGSIMIAQIIATYNSAASPEDGVKFAVGLSFLTGVFELFLGLLRLGPIMDFISVPVISGIISNRIVFGRIYF